LPSAATAFVAIVIATVVIASNGNSTRLNVETSGGATSGEAMSEPEVSAGGSTPERSLESAGSAAEAKSGPLLHAPAADAANANGFLGTQRQIERSAQVVLGAAPEDVADDASQVFEAVHAVHGVVLSSSVRDGSEGGAEAAFQLLIPSARLDDALGSISGIDEVLSRRDGTNDITAPTVGVAEQLQDSKARVDSLLNELAASETEAERETIEAQLSSERRRSAVLRAQLTELHRRASLSHVSVRIEGDGTTSGSGGGWDIGDAAADAGHILAVAAGVTLIGLAVLGPIALIALLCWLGRRAWVGFGRRRALS
jgi:hypothetical protein